MFKWKSSGGLSSRGVSFPEYSLEAHSGGFCAQGLGLSVSIKAKASDGQSQRLREVGFLGDEKNEKA